MAFGPFGAREGLGAGVVEGRDPLGGLRADLLQGGGRFGAGLLERGRGLTSHTLERRGGFGAHTVDGRGRFRAQIGEFGGGGAAGFGGLGAGAAEFGAGGVEFVPGARELVANAGEFGLGVGEGLGAFGGGLFGPGDGPLGVGGTLDGEVAFGGRGGGLLCGLAADLFDLGGGLGSRGVDVLGGLPAGAFDLRGRLLARRTQVGLGRAAEGEGFLGRGGRDPLDLPERFRTRRIRLGRESFGALGRRGRVLGRRLGDRARVLGLPPRLLGRDGAHLRFRDPPRRIRLHRLDLRLGHGRVGEGGQFGDRCREVGAQLLGQSTELTQQLIGSQPGSRHRALLRHSDTSRGCLRLLLHPLPLPPGPPPRMVRVVAVLRRAAGPAPARNRTGTAGIVADTGHGWIVAAPAASTAFPRTGRGRRLRRSAEGDEECHRPRPGRVRARPSPHRSGSTPPRQPANPRAARGCAPPQVKRPSGAPAATAIWTIAKAASRATNSHAQIMTATPADGRDPRSATVAALRPRTDGDIPPLRRRAAPARTTFSLRRRPTKCPCPQRRGVETVPFLTADK
ncbi:hypothetical protein [Nocardia farcinica]|uniref:hypothetical protein n=1 Tax=Nocardia farcinica TaxID=37329 RepID=UPI0024556A2A|nr:hypothetical protein [Nocardia farcinica]